MSITFVCQNCGKQFRVKDELAGKKAKCAACGHPITIPAAEAEPEAEPADEYEVETEPTSSAASGASPVPSGHTVEPTSGADQDDDEFELEPPVETHVEHRFFFDDDDDNASPSPKKPNPAKPAQPRTASAGSKSDPNRDAESLELADEPVQQPAEPEETEPCPSCGQAMAKSAVLCVGCGFDRRTGKQIEPLKPKRGIGKLFGGK